MNQKGNEPMTKRQSVLLSDDLWEWIQTQARKQRRNISEIIRMIIEDAKENKWGE